MKKPLWLEEAKSYGNNASEYISFETHFDRGNEAIKILERNFLRNGQTKLKLLMVGLGL